MKICYFILLSTNEISTLQFKFPTSVVEFFPWKSLLRMNEIDLFVCKCKNCAFINMYKYISASSISDLVVNLKKRTSVNIKKLQILQLESKSIQPKIFFFNLYNFFYKFFGIFGMCFLHSPFCLSVPPGCISSLKSLKPRESRIRREF